MIISLKKFYLYFFKRDDFLNRKLKGECKQCGECCKHLLGYFKCPLLTKDNKCKAHTHKPLFCRLTPIDIGIRNPNCGYLKKPEEYSSPKESDDKPETIHE
tara:strand:+ start:865 stop:1167 length:303 start_codon:yes stop_codon:yes gene_type:complete